jgi:hypothetical protein
MYKHFNPVRSSLASPSSFFGPGQRSSASKERAVADPVGAHAARGGRAGGRVPGVPRPAGTNAVRRAHSSPAIRGGRAHVVLVSVVLRRAAPGLLPRLASLISE